MTSNRFTGRLLLLSVLLALLSAALLPLSGVHALAAEKSGKIPFPRPQSHAGNWLEYHGGAVDANLSPAQHAAPACLTCHEKTDCVSCHMTQPPRDHTNTWRTLSHGLMAEGNRERCRTCHRQDFCVRCHNETAPRTHVAGWRTRHCSWCHYGSGLAPAENCAVCHRRAPHTSAPHVVNPQEACTVCHMP